MGKKLNREFYENGKVEQVAQQLLGKILVTNINGELCAGRITETEAYNGRMDRACHAYQKKTQRTEIMYGPGGFSYVYLVYGIHHLFNIVTNKRDFADAVLIRAIEPHTGIEHMLKRRGLKAINPKLCCGPGNAAKALGLNNLHNAVDLTGDLIWVEDAPILKSQHVVETTRIGVDYAGEDAKLRWRFYDSRSKFVSKR